MTTIRALLEMVESIREDIAEKKSTCILIPLPPELASEFPPAPNKHGESPHISVLFVGPQTEQEFDKTVEIVRELIQHWNPFHVDLAGYGEFLNHAGEVIPHAIPYADEIPLLHNAIWGKLQAAGLAVKHHPGPFRPHATLAYQEKGKSYDGPKPKGQFTVNGLKISGYRPETAMFRRPQAEGEKGRNLALPQNAPLDVEWRSSHPTKMLTPNEWAAKSGDYGRFGMKTEGRLRLKLRESKTPIKFVPHEFTPANVRYVTIAELRAMSRELEKTPRYMHEKKLREMAEGLAGYGLSKRNVLVMDFNEEAKARAFMERAGKAGYSVEAGDSPVTVYVRHPEITHPVGEQSQGLASRGLDSAFLSTYPDDPSPNTTMKDVDESSRPRLKLRRGSS